MNAERCNCGTHTKAACDFAGVCGQVAATLPAAPAPTAIALRTENYDVICDRRDLFDFLRAAWREGQSASGEMDERERWNLATDHATKAIQGWATLQHVEQAAPAPTEQQDELPITRSTYGSLEACEAEQVRRNAALTEQAGELLPLPEMDSLADIEYAQATPEDWDADYRSTWQKLQLAERNKMQWRAYALQLRAARATPPAPTPAAAEISDDEWSGMLHGPKSLLKREDWDPVTRKPKAAAPLPRQAAVRDGTIQERMAFNATIDAIFGTTQTAPDQAKTAPVTTEKEKS